MITLAVEVIYYRKRKGKPEERLKKKQMDLLKKQDSIAKISPKQITIGSTFKPIKEYQSNRVSPIILYPKARSRITMHKLS